MPILVPFSRTVVARERTKGDQTESADMKENPPQSFETSTPSSAAPTLRFDWQDWLPYLEDSDIPDEQKRQWIETLWSIVIAFVDLGFDIKADAESCGEKFDLKAVLEAAVVNSADTAQPAEKNKKKGAKV